MSDMGLRVSFKFTLLIFALSLMVACQEQTEHTAPAIYARDSVPIMTTYGINTLVSDSGVIKYRIVAERWIVNQNVNPSRHIFDKGVLLTQFDEKFNINSYIQCDTAYYYDTNHLWELRGRVRILTKDGLRFSSEQLFWNEMEHKIYSNSFSRLVTPERTLQGRYFVSDDKMTKYSVSNTSGSFEKGSLSSGAPQATPGDTSQTPAQPVQQTVPRPKTPMLTPGSNGHFK